MSLYGAARIIFPRQKTSRYSSKIGGPLQCAVIMRNGTKGRTTIPP